MVQNPRWPIRPTQLTPPPDLPGPQPRRFGGFFCIIFPVRPHRKLPHRCRQSVAQRQNGRSGSATLLYHRTSPGVQPAAAFEIDVRPGSSVMMLSAMRGIISGRGKARTRSHRYRHQGSDCSPPAPDTSAQHQPLGLERNSRTWDLCSLVEALGAEPLRSPVDVAAGVREGAPPDRRQASRTRTPIYPPGGLCFALPERRRGRRRDHRQPRTRSG